MSEPKKRGRKPIGDAPMTAAERKRRQREMMTAAGIRTINVKLTEYTAGILKRFCEMSGFSESDHLSIVAGLAICEWAKDVERQWPEIAERLAKIKESSVNNEVK